MGCKIHLHLTTTAWTCFWVKNTTTHCNGCQSPSTSYSGWFELLHSSMCKDIQGCNQHPAPNLLRCIMGSWSVFVPALWQSYGILLVQHPYDSNPSCWRCTSHHIKATYWVWKCHFGPGQGSCHNLQQCTRQKVANLQRAAPFHHFISFCWSQGLHHCSSIWRNRPSTTR